MLVFLIFAGLLILGIILLNYDFEYLNFVTMVVGIIGTTICALLVIINLISLDVDYQNKLEQRAMIEYRIEKGEEIAGNEMLYTQIVEFNNDLRIAKKFGGNPWTNWFANWKIAEMDYITIDGVN